MINKTVHEGKSIAIIAYFWWIGLVIALIMNNSKKNSFASFHIRQVIGLYLLSLAMTLVYKYAGETIGYVLSMGVLVLWVIGLIGAFNGQEKKVPLLGDQFQEWFKSIS